MFSRHVTLRPARTNQNSEFLSRVKTNISSLYIVSGVTSALVCVTVRLLFNRSCSKVDLSRNTLCNMYCMMKGTLIPV